VPNSDYRNGFLETARKRFRIGAGILNQIARNFELTPATCDDMQSIDGGASAQQTLSEVGRVVLSLARDVYHGLAEDEASVRQRVEKRLADFWRAYPVAEQEALAERTRKTALAREREEAKRFAREKHRIEQEQRRLEEEVRRKRVFEEQKAAFWGGVWQAVELDATVSLAHVDLLLARPQYLDLEGKTPTVPRLLALLKADKAQGKKVRDELAARKTLAADKRAAEKQVNAIKREAAQMQRAWEGELIHAADIPVRLGITKTEYTRWRTDGRIKVTTTRQFRKWGATLEAALHHPTDIAHITPELIEQWRTEHKTRTAERRSHGAKKAAITRAIPRVLARLAEAGFTRVAHASSTWTWDFEVEIEVYAHISRCLLSVQCEVPVPRTMEGVDALQSQLEQAAAAFDMEHAKEYVEDRVQEGLEAQGFDSPDKLDGHDGTWGVLWAYLRRGRLWSDISSEHVAQVVKGVAANRQRLEYIARAHKEFRLDRYPESFPLARQIGRKMHLIVGPTNSGKTHEALEALRKAKSGVYLAPLRLLAMEVYDRLTAAGVPCELHTGEEHIVIPGARHICATVEMLDAHTPVEVAVIDECQMLLDEHRGWAWTAALTGAPAARVYAGGFGPRGAAGEPAG
jgi:hypothetical protein